MSAKGLKVKVGSKTVELTQNDYKGAGGEGTIYVKGAYAYKIYHDPAKMIPTGKIKELAALQLPNVLGPQEPIFDMAGKPIGFVMRYVDKTEFLVRLFTKGFRDKMGIDPAMINALVKRMQDTLKAIHAKKTLVVDYNEMNFLTSAKFDEIYHIDVDCYQTPSYPATALMDSVRDRKVQNNQFTTLSDWFSFGVVAFQLYMGTHPYKGRHTTHGKDWLKLMDLGISVFNKDMRMPPNVQAWDVLPKGHRRWFEGIFEKGDRSAPPEPDQLPAQAGSVQPQIIDSTDKFVLSLVNDYKSNIQAARWIQGNLYAYTDTAVYVEKKLLAGYGHVFGYTSKRTEFDFINAGSVPMVVEFNSLLGKAKYYTIDRKFEQEFDSAGIVVANDRIYTVTGGSLTEITCQPFGTKMVASKQNVANIFPNHKIMDGCVVQDILGTCRLSIPFEAGAAKTIHIPELDRVRIVEGKYEARFAIFIGELEGRYNRYTIVFNKDLSAYSLRKEEGVTIQDINFTVMDRGVCVAANGDNVEIFADNNQVKVVPDSPLTGGQKLLTFGNKIYVQHGSKIYHLSLK